VSVTEFSIRGGLVIGGDLVDGALVIENGAIARIERGSTDLPQPVIEADIVSPGLLDLQVNGGFGVEVGANPEAFRRLAAALPASGVTGFLPTIVSSPANFYPAVFKAFNAARDAPGARMLGLHVEGPFLSPKRIGAHRREVIENAQPSLIEELLASPDLRIFTLAPELPHAAEWIRRFRKRGVVVSLGHTDATADEFARGVDAGAIMVTHLFNAMSPFNHRAPNVIGSALVDERVTCGLIVDGIHSDPLSVRLAIRAKGVAGICLVTDMMSAAGMPSGQHMLFGKNVVVDETSARLADGTLAGSIITMDAAIRNTVRWGGVTAAQALSMASEVPARLLGLPDLGRLAQGANADIVLLNDRLEVVATYVRGELVYHHAQTQPRNSLSGRSALARRRQHQSG
jgi:N-acetylglucosamine-6-phosphate deacetylase